jgi:hypothetical protein
MGSVKVKLVEVGDSVSVRKGRRLETTRLAETRDMSRVSRLQEQQIYNSWSYSHFTIADC